VDALGIERAHIAGQSLGGAICAPARAGPSRRSALATLLVEPGLPTVLAESPEFLGEFQETVALYQAGERAAAIDAFGKAVWTVSIIGGWRLRAAT
jgi:pimeloyl-ACP methyl ester carboxylesterase